MSQPSQGYWFKMPASVVDRGDLNVYELALYVLLRRYADRKTGTAELGHRQLQQQLGVKSRHTVDKYIRSLEDKGLIVVTRTIDEATGERLPNRYEVLGAAQDANHVDAESAQGVVHDVHRSGSPDAPQVVHDVHRSGSPDAPQVVHDVHRSGSPDAPGVVHDVHHKRIDIEDREIESEILEIAEAVDRAPARKSAAAAAQSTTPQRPATLSQIYQILEGGTPAARTAPTPGSAAPPPKKNVYELYAENIGDLTPMMRENLLDAVKEFGEEKVKEGIREAVEHNAPTWAYMNAIFLRWRTGLTKAKSKYTEDYVDLIGPTRPLQ